MMLLTISDMIARPRSWLCAPTFKYYYLMAKGRQNHRIIQAASNCWRSYDPYGDNVPFYPFFLKKCDLFHQDAMPPYKVLKLMVNFKQVYQCKAQKDSKKLKILWSGWLGKRYTVASIFKKQAVKIILFHLTICRSEMQ